MKSILRLITFLFMPVIPNLPAQGYPQSPEKLHLHIDRNKYIAGEDIWFSIYCTDAATGQLSPLSSIAYVELLNPWNYPVARGRFALSKGRGDGTFQIPDSASSGDYCVRAYTGAMKNSGSAVFFITDIKVVNAFGDGSYNFREYAFDRPGLLQHGGSRSFSQSLNIACDTLAGIRKKVTVSISGIPKGSSLPGYDLSISVVPEESAGNLCSIDPVQAHKTPVSHESPAKTVENGLPFETGIHNFKVRVIQNDPSAGSPDFVYMSVQGKTAWFDYAENDTGGTYTFRLPVDSRERNLILQPDKVAEGMSIQVLPSYSEEYPEGRAIKGNIPDSLLPIFSELSFNFQTGRIYRQKARKDAADTDIITGKARRFYGIPEMEVHLDDYISLPSMQEVFFELLPGINFVSRRDGYQFLIANPLTGDFYAGAPLIMIDGVIINDPDIVARLNPEIVERIEVIRTPYLIGDLVLYGIVNIITRRGDFSAVTMPAYALLIPYRVVEKPAVFVSPDYSEKTQRQSRIPDLRNTIYWNPSLRSADGGSIRFEFHTPDNPGEYRINIMGYSPSGAIISACKKITVKR